jgi:broad specificity phosphatase PhoE
VFATADSAHSSRPRQTVTPLAAALGLSINADYSNRTKHIADLAALLWTAPYAGKTILICWHHGTLPALAAALKGTGATKWWGTVFDRIWIIAYPQGMAIAQVGQQLLFGDKTDVPSVPW